MTNFPALEVVIGLAFVYFVLALICSAVAETISSLQGKRPKMLAEAARGLRLAGSYRPPASRLVMCLTNALTSAALGRKVAVATRRFDALRTISLLRR